MGIRRINIFPKCICAKTIIITHLGFELVYFEAAVEHFSNYTTGSPARVTVIKFNLLRHSPGNCKFSERRKKQTLSLISILKGARHSKKSNVEDK